MIITSRANPTIKLAHNLHHRKDRQATGLFFMEGIRIIGAALEQGLNLRKLFYSPDDLRSDYGKSIILKARAQGVAVLEVSSHVMAYLALKENPQGMIAIGEKKEQHLEDIDLQPGGLWIGLHEVADPGNLGTILRTSDATGCKGVILIGHCTDPYDPEAIRASMGAIFCQQVIPSDPNAFITFVSERKVPVIGTSDRAIMEYLDYSYPDPMILMMGSEREGLPDLLMNLCQAKVRIPMVGSSDSLNLAIATAVVLYEILNQRRQSKKPRGELC